jgi:ABC-type dipeptide/oligopeptide/nickel transport system permease component
LLAKQPLLKYILHRGLQAIPLLFWVIVINFMIVHLAPGDPVSYLAGQYEATPEFVETMRREYGLDKPLLTQLGVYLLKVIQGDLGYSMRFDQPVMALILSRVPATFLLVGTGLVLTAFFGVFFGVTYTRRSAVSENTALLAAIAGHSMPSFWLGQIALIIFSLHLGLFPSQGMMSVRTQHTGLSAVLDILHHLALPALTYAVYHMTLIFRLTRSKMLETLSQDFIITARGKGLDRRTILYRHALPHVLMPVVTVLGVNAGFMIAGSVLVETVFAWPGMGRLMYEAITARDYPMLLGLFISISVVVIIANLVTDIIYALIDPRVTYK